MIIEFEEYLRKWTESAAVTLTKPVRDFEKCFYSRIRKIRECYRHLDVHWFVKECLANERSVNCPIRARMQGYMHVAYIHVWNLLVSLHIAIPGLCVQRVIL